MGGDLGEWHSVGKWAGDECMTSGYPRGSNPFPWVLVLASMGIGMAAGVGLMLFFWK